VLLGEHTGDRKCRCGAPAPTGQSLHRPKISSFAMPTTGTVSNQVAVPDLLRFPMPPPGWHSALCLPSLCLPNGTVPTNCAGRHSSFPPLPTGHSPQMEKVKFLS
jgi:hypothetical protein